MAPPSSDVSSPMADTFSDSGRAAHDAGMNEIVNGTVEDYKNLYTHAYTHGYTEGYVHGNGLPNQMPIAIVGMSCRLPGNVTTPDEFWELCSRARTGWSEIPKERFDNSSFYHPNPGKSGCHNAAGGNFLKEDLGLFDAPFFSLTAQEAISMDPQQRILLECTFEALDSAGIPKHEVVGKDVGVFIGGSFSEYESQSFMDADAIPMHQATGCATAMQSNRISHFFDLRGPSFTMDTACSSTLVALHQACQSLRNGESKAAIVGGCHLNMLPDFWVSMSMSRLFGDAGRSFAFDSRGTGYGRGEGCGMVIIKPLDQALKDNDNIRAVINASGINQDGKTPGITMPNGSAQEALMTSVYQSAKIDPRETGYVEAHGTGTKVGDPIEATALHNIFGEGRTARNPLFIGSVKSNIGHLEAASGIVAVIKTALMLERGFILPNYDFKKPNEKIPLAKWNMKVPISQRPWPRPMKYASVNNFGFGGTNAHLVMERAPFLKDDETEPSDSSFQARKLFVLSANDKAALETIMKNIGIYLEQRPEVFQNDLLANVAYTLGQRRSLMQWRVAISSTSAIDLIADLNSGKVSPAKAIEAPRLGFIFTGQGAQWNAMGRELYSQYPAFAITLDACDRCLASFGASFSLIEELKKDAATSLVNEAHISQPACTAIQLALTDLLRSWGVTPTAVAGHSSGEIGAAYAAGLLGIDSCMAISYYRGMSVIELKDEHPTLRGSMMAVGCTKEDVQPLIDNLKAEKVKIACYNSPTSLTISGDEAAIDELQTVMEQKQLFNRKLQVDVAYHSHHMDLAAKSYRNALGNIEPTKSTDIKFHSSLLGKLIDGQELGTGYWVENLTQSVRFSEALTSMVAPVDGQRTGVDMIVELGPHSALAGPVKQILKANGPDASKIPYASPLIRKKDAVETALDMAGALFVRGVSIDFAAINRPVPSKQPTLLVDMPRYPWNHKTKYWHEPRQMQKHKNRTAPRNDLLGTLANYSNDLEPTWRNMLRIDDLPWLRHHKIQGLTLFPMSGFIAMAVEAAAQIAITRNVEYEKFELRDVAVTTPLMVTEDEVEMTLQLRPYEEGTADHWDEFRIHSFAANKGWTEHCKGLIAIKNAGFQAIDNSQREIINSAKDVVEKDQIYDSLTELGVSYGPTFQGMNSCLSNDNSSAATITTVDTSQEMPNGFETSYVIHPAFLEQLVELYWPILGAGRTSVKTVYLPSSIGKLSISRQITELTKKPGDSLKAFCSATPAPLHPRPIQASMFATALNDPENAILILDQLTIAPIMDSSGPSEEEAHRELCYKLDWEPILEPALISDVLPNGHTEHVEDVQNGITNGNTNGIVESATNGVTNGVWTPVIEEIPDVPASDIVIVRGDSDEQQVLASSLADSLEHAAGKRPAIGTLSSVGTEGKLCIFLAELEKPLLSKLDAAQFTALQKVLTSVDGILWVVRGAYADSSNPDTNMVTGLSRSIRSETLLKFATLDLDPESTASEEATADAVLEIFKAVFGPKAEANCELEFREKKGKFLTPRIVDDAEMNEYVHKQTHSSLELTKFVQEDRPLKMVIGTPGSFETLHFVDQSIADLSTGEIEIQVKAVGLNAKDLLSASGKFDSFEFGMESSGVVTKVGSSVENFVVGDRVAGLSVTQGAISTLTQLKANLAFKIRDDMSFETGASIPVAYLTAYYGLIDLGRLAKDETVLISGADSAAGQAAICVAQSIGADITAVTLAETKHTIKELFGLPDDKILFSNELAAGKRDFDVVLKSQSNDTDTLRALWASLGSFGRFVEVAKQDANAKLDISRIDNNRTFVSVDLISLAIQRPKIMARLVSEVAESLIEQKIKPVSHTTVFPISNVETAFKALQSGKTSGKLVVSPQPEDEVKATPSQVQKQMLRPDASYILIGGTGGLGRSMARWMVGKGARNIVLVSRSGSVTGKVKELVDDVATLGAKIVVRQCNVSDAESVQNLVTNELTDLPEVKGIIHGAMVLRDVLFEKMTFEEYDTVIESKVRGAWNFQNALKSQSLDFFVVISSAAGAVGNRGQAAYSAANTFLNAFVQHRLKAGQPASSIDLTAVSDAGYLAENAEAAAEVSRNLGSDTICEAEVLALIGAAIEGRLSSACNNHTITGMRITNPSPFWTPDAKFKHLRLAAEAEAAAAGGGEGQTISFNAALKASKSIEEAQDVVCRGLLSKLPSVLMLEAEDLDVTKSLANYALDSLVAIEVRNYITREFEANLQVLELLSSGSIESLAKTICVKSKLVSF